MGWRNHSPGRVHSMALMYIGGAEWRHQLNNMEGTKSAMMALFSTAPLERRLGITIQGWAVWGGYPALELITRPWITHQRFDAEDKRAAVVLVGLDAGVKTVSFGI